MDPDTKADLARLGVQAALMKELIRSPMWDCYVEYIEKMIEDAIERMLNGTKEDFEAHRGAVKGFRDALRIPENIILWAERAARN